MSDAAEDERNATAAARFDAAVELLEGKVFPCKVEMPNGTVEGFGLTKRELFAALALQWLLSEEPYHRSEQVVCDAIWYADKLLEELDK